MASSFLGFHQFSNPKCKLIYQVPECHFQVLIPGPKLINIPLPVIVNCSISGIYCIVSQHTSDLLHSIHILLFCLDEFYFDMKFLNQETKY